MPNLRAGFTNFNPLRREGGDEGGVTDVEHYVHFNPLRREGGDVNPQEVMPQADISIHSAARAETDIHWDGIIIKPISIHSAARAETAQGDISKFYADDFNPLRREGGDLFSIAHISM